MIMGHRKKLTGSQGGHQVHDEEEQDWVIKPALRPGFGVKGTVNEYIAGSLAIRTSLNVPEHSVLYLPQQTIDTFPVLSSFSAGHVLGIRYENGVDLEAATRSGLVAHILSGLTGASNQITALGIITTDTWLWNHDRSMGSAPLHPELDVKGQTSNEQNLYFKKLQGSSGLWDLMAIDFGHSFHQGYWGATSMGEWETVVLGTMRFFYETSLLQKNYSDHRDDFEAWVQKVDALDLRYELDTIINSMPAEWLTGLLGNPIEKHELDDLSRRLFRQRSMLSDTLANHYSLATARY